MKEMKETKEKILSTLEILYGPCNHKKYFLVQGRTEQDVRKEIVNKLKENDIVKDDDTILDLYVVTSQMNGDVFIQV